MKSLAGIAFGKFVYAEFAKVGIETKGRDGSKFGQHVADAVKKRVKKDELVDEALHTVTVKVLTGGMQLRSLVVKVVSGAEQTLPTSVQGAEQYIITAAVFAGIDAERKAGRKTKKHDQVGDHLVDLGAMEGFAAVISAEMISKMNRDLAMVHPRAVEWVETMLEERPKTELAAQWGTTPQAIFSFEKRYMGKIQAVVAKYLKADEGSLAA